MARLPNRGIFDSKRDLVCRKAFKAGSRTYATGEPFPGDKLTTPITHRRMKQLFDGGWLGYADDVTIPHPVADEVVVPEEEVTEKEEPWWTKKKKKK